MNEAKKKALQKTLGDAMRVARKKLDISQPTVAERIGISCEFYSRIERGRSMPSVPVLATISATLGASPDILMGGKEGIEGFGAAAPEWSKSIIRLARTAKNLPTPMINHLIRQANLFSDLAVGMSREDLEGALEGLSWLANEAGTVGGLMGQDEHEQHLEYIDQLVVKLQRVLSSKVQFDG